MVINEKKVDTSKYEDFLFEMDDFIKRKNNLSAENDEKNLLSFEMKTEDNKEELVAHSVVHMDDIHTLVTNIPI